MIIFFLFLVNECKVVHLPKIIDVFVMSTEIPVEVKGQYILKNTTLYQKDNIVIEHRETDSYWLWRDGNRRIGRLFTNVSHLEHHQIDCDFELFGRGRVLLSYCKKICLAR